uniref:Ig-like domain-containing protein n=1 Tax=Cyprinus carpio TaxID=7962 RepID=A0A8C2Q007_CYPCA
MGTAVCTCVHQVSLFRVSLSLSLSLSISVRGYSGGGVIITCRYDREYTDNTKYFCRGEWSTCSDLIKTDKKNKWVDSGRFSLFDDTRAAVFTVTFRDLSEQDSGTYWCGVEKPGLDPYTEVNLNVVTGDSISVTGYSGGEVNITCRYDRKYTDNAKYFCRGQWSTCSDLIKTDKKNKWVDSGRFSLFDDTRAAVFTVTFRNLSEQDSGTYWCGVEKPGLDPYTEVNLNVLKMKICFSTLILSPPIGYSYKIQIFDDVIRINYNASIMKIFRAVNNFSVSPQVSHTGYDYDEIKDTHSQLPTNPSDSSNTVYATAQLPTNPSDSSDLNYAVVNFQKKADCPDRVSALEQGTEPSTAPRVPQHEWLPTAPGVCSRCVCVHCCMCALWMG